MLTLTDEYFVQWWLIINHCTLTVSARLNTGQIVILVTRAKKIQMRKKPLHNYWNYFLQNTAGIMRANRGKLLHNMEWTFKNKANRQQKPHSVSIPVLHKFPVPRSLRLTSTTYA